jgi:hypothetical protein
MLGCAGVEDLVGRKIMEFAHPDYQADWQYLQQRLWQHKLPHFTLETCLVRCDGSSFWCQVTSIRFPEGEQELGYTLLEGISDRKALELSLKRVYDAQETILHLVSHDLKTPLAYIQMIVEVLQNDEQLLATHPARIQEETHAFLTLIERSCVRMVAPKPSGGPKVYICNNGRTEVYHRSENCSAMNRCTYATKVASTGKRVAWDCASMRNATSSRSQAIGRATGRG